MDGWWRETRVTFLTYLAGQRGDLAAPAEAHDADLPLCALALERLDRLGQVRLDLPSVGSDGWWGA